MPKAARPAARCLLGSLEVGARRRRGGHQVERSSKRTGLGHLPTGGRGHLGEEVAARCSSPPSRWGGGQAHWMCLVSL